MGRLSSCCKKTFSNSFGDAYDPQYYHPLIELPDPEDDLFPDETVWILKKPLLKDSYDPENPQELEKPFSWRTD